MKTINEKFYPKCVDCGKLLNSVYHLNNAGMWGLIPSLYYCDTETCKQELIAFYDGVAPVDVPNMLTIGKEKS